MVIEYLQTSRFEIVREVRARIVWIAVKPTNKNKQTKQSVKQHERWDNFILFICFLNQNEMHFNFVFRSEIWDFTM